MPFRKSLAKFNDPVSGGFKRMSKGIGSVARGMGKAVSNPQNIVQGAAMALGAKNAYGMLSGSKATGDGFSPSVIDTPGTRDNPMLSRADLLDDLPEYEKIPSASMMSKYGGASSVEGTGGLEASEVMLVAV